MNITTIKELANKEATEILAAAESDQLTSKELIYDKKGKPIGDFTDIYNHSGVYVFTIEKGSKIVVYYVGKSENDGRLRQHIASENKDGTDLKPSVKTKHNRIKESIKRGFKVRVHLYSNENFDKSSLSCIEIRALELAKINFKKIFPGEREWIQRIG